MNKAHWIDAIPAMTGLGAALVDAALAWSGTYRPATATAALWVSLAIALGRALSVWLHQRGA